MSVKDRTSISALALILALLPTAAVIAPIQLPYLLAVGGIVGLFSILKKEPGASRWPPLWDLPLILLLFGLAIYAAISALWALDGSAAIKLALRLGLLFLAAAGFALLLTQYAWTRTVRRAALGGLIFGGALLAIEIATGGVVRQGLEGLLGLERFQPRTRLEQLLEYSRTAPVILLIAWPLFRISLGANAALSSLALASLACGAALWVIPNGAAKLALVAIAVTVALALLLGRRRILLIIAGAAILVGLASPFIANRLAGPDVMARLVHKDSPLAERGGFSLMHRLSIWGFAASKTMEKPLLGWGMDASRRMPGGQDKIRVEDLGVPVDEIHRDIDDRMRIRHLKEYRLMKLRLHPHNAALQVWLELGLVGTLLIVAIVARTLWLASRWNDWLPIPVATGGIVIASLSFGIWQGWWLAALLIAACLCLSVRPNRETFDQ